MDWKNHPFLGKTLGEWQQEYIRELKRHRLYGTGKARAMLYARNDYNLQDDGHLIWDHAIWIQCLDWLFMQDKDIDMTSLYSYLEGTPEQIYYCMDLPLRGGRCTWHEWLDDQIDFMIHSE